MMAGHAHPTGPAAERLERTSRFATPPLAREATVDLASPQRHPLAKTAKDVSAAAVLLGAVASAIMGLLILGPPLLRRFGP